MFLSILCSIKIERHLFLKFLKNLALFDSYFWPFNKTHEKIIAIFVISAIMASISNVFIKFCWPDEKFELKFSATIVIIKHCFVVFKQFSSSTCHWDHEGVNRTMMMMFSTLVSVYLTIALVDGKPNEFFFLLFLCKKVVRIRLLKLERLVTIDSWNTYNIDANNERLCETFLSNSTQ